MEVWQGLLGAAYTVVVFLIGYFVGKKKGERTRKDFMATYNIVRKV